MREKKNIWGFSGSFTAVCDKIFDTLALGLLWILCSLPIVTIGASSTALYYAAVKCIKHDEGYAVQEFFHAFRRDFKKATILWLLIAAATFALQLNIGILMKEFSGYLSLFFICLYAAVAVLLIAAACYMFAALSRFEMPVGWFVKLGLYMTVRYFGTTLAILALQFCFGVLVFKMPMLLFLAPGPMALAIAEFMERVLEKHAPQTEE